MTLTKAEAKSIVKDINGRYETLQALTNDQLRARVKQIEKQIADCSDTKQELDRQLPEVFAIVKETARRFSQGDIVVTANENDILLADESDFVMIKDGDAVYKNKWVVDKHLTTWFTMTNRSWVESIFIMATQQKWPQAKERLL